MKINKMPYIKKQFRSKFLFVVLPNTPGELTFVLYKQCLLYLKKYKESYDIYNQIIGSLECTKLELYRRKITLYEDKKIKENGDIIII